MTTLIDQRVEFPKLDPVWLQAPSEKSTEFASTFIAVSMALQRALRENLPAAYFENLDRFRDVPVAQAVLVYQSSRVFRGKIRTDLTRDVLNQRLMARLVRMSRTSLHRRLGEVEARLLEAGDVELAARYAPKRFKNIMKSVQRLSRSRRRLAILVRGEGVLMDALVELGGLGALARPARTSRVAHLKRKWNVELRRMYPRENFQRFAPKLLEVATQALRNHLAIAPPAGSHGDAARSLYSEP